MAFTYALVAVLASVIAWYAFVLPFKKRKLPPSLTQSRKPSKLDTSDKEEILRASKSPVTEASRVSIAADIMTARSDAAEKAQQAAARAAEQTSASQPLTPVGARVADKMEVAEAVASKRKSRTRLMDGSKVFGALPFRCKGIRLELGRSVDLMEGFSERDVPERRHSIIGIVRPGDSIATEHKPSRSLPDMKTLRETAEEGIARANQTTVAFSQTLIDSTEESAAELDTPLGKDTVKIVGPEVDRTPTDSTEDTPGDESPPKRRSVSIQSEPHEMRSPSPRTSPRSSFSTGQRIKSSALPLDVHERRTAKSQHRAPYPRSRRGTLETVQSESMILTPGSESETPTSEMPSFGSFSEVKKEQQPRVTKPPRPSPLHKKSSVTAGQSLSSVESDDEPPSKFSVVGDRQTDGSQSIKSTRKQKFKEALDNVEKIVDKITAPIVDTMRSAALSKKRRSSSPDILSPSSSNSPRTSKQYRSSKLTTNSSKDKSEETSDSARLSHQKNVLPRLWDSVDSDVETATLKRELSTSKPDEDKREPSPSKGAKEVGESEEKKPVLPRLWGSNDANEDDTSSQTLRPVTTSSKTQSSSMAKDRGSESSRSTKRSKFLPQLWPSKSPSKIESKSNDREKGKVESEQTLEDTSEGNEPVKHSERQSPEYESTSAESVSGKSGTEPGSLEVPTTSSVTTISRPTQSVKSMKGKNISKTSSKSSRHKFPAEKRHGMWKRADGTPILPVSQATLQAIFSKNPNTEQTISEIMEPKSNKQLGVDQATSKDSEAKLSSNTEIYPDEKPKKTTSSVESAVIAKGVVVTPVESEEQEISSSTMNLSPNRSHYSIRSDEQRAHKKGPRSEPTKPFSDHKKQQKSRPKSVSSPESPRKARDERHALRKYEDDYTKRSCRRKKI